MSLLNANAFYEMGIRHMKQKPIIHMYRAGDPIPFDVAPHRAIPFSYSHPDDLTNAQALLKTAVDEVLKPDFKIENPVTRARGIVALEQGATSGEKILLDQVRSCNPGLPLLNASEARARILQPFMAAANYQCSLGTLWSASAPRRFLPEHADIIQAALTRQFGHAALISQGGAEIVFAVPGDININEFEIPGGPPKGLEISPLRPYPGNP